MWDYVISVHMGSDQVMPQLESGIAGLDELLRGGYVGGRMYLVAGGPGTGKTTLGMHFLEAGLPMMKPSS